MSNGNGADTAGWTGRVTKGPQAAAELERSWREDPRWNGIQRGYDAAEVIRLRGSLVPEQTLARRGAERLWEMLSSGECVRALGALTGAQAVQMVQAGLKSIYLSNPLNQVLKAQARL